jgi:hypothetical protein
MEEHTLSEYAAKYGGPENWRLVVLGASHGIGNALAGATAATRRRTLLNKAESIV